MARMLIFRPARAENAWAAAEKLGLPFGTYRAFDWNDDRPQLDLH